MKTKINRFLINFLKKISLKNSELEQLQHRMVAIEKEIVDKHTGYLSTYDVLGASEKDKLLAELRILKLRESFLVNHRQTNISLFVGIGAIITSVFVAVGVPWYQRIAEKEDQVEIVYKNLITNQDVFVSNSNGIRSLSKKSEIADLPESYVEDKISDDARKEIQNTFGLIQYRFFLYYLQQTALMNEEIEQMRNSFIFTDTEHFSEISSTKKYFATMAYLSLEGKDTKFNYGKDTECLEYFFEQNFSYLTIDGRGKITECSNETLEARLFNYFGYLPADTPKWLRPLLRRALNSREAGLGNRLINI